jgi:hypothetical protein
MPSYARQWSYETGCRGSALIRKALSHNHKIANPNLWSAVAILAISLAMAMTTGSR